MGQHQEDCQPMSLHFSCTDVAKSVAFYQDVLGFELKECWPSKEAPMWASLHLCGQTIMLGSQMPNYEGPDKSFYEGIYSDFKKAAGGGVLVYLQVDDVDGYYTDVRERGGKPACEPKNEFYGLRNFMIQDADGYRLAFYMPIVMTSCQSCGMPLSDAKEGQMYCQHCTDDKGSLHPYEQVLEGTIQGYFMGMQKMARAEAEVAAKAHLAKMPAWACMK